MAEGTFCGTGLGGNAPKPGDPDNNSILSAAPAFGGIDVSWTWPDYNPHGVAYVNLYRSTAGTADNAVFHAVVTGNFFYDKTTTATLIEYFYWIEIVSVNGTVGDWIGPASATAKPPIEQVIEGLTGKIDSGKLAQSLKGEVDRIPLIDTKISDETNARLADMDALNAAFSVTDAYSDETRALLDTERLERQNADGAFVTQFDQVYVDVDASLASQKTLITTEYQDAISAAVFDLVSQSDLDSATASLEQSLQAEYEDHVAQQLTFYETAVDAQAARASMSSALQASIDDNAARIVTEESARADGDSALSIRVDELSVKIDSLPVFSSGFEDGSDFTQWTASAGHTVAQDSDAYIGTQAGLITSTATAPVSSGIPEGVVATVAEGTAAAFSGKRIRVRISAKQPASNPSAEFAVAYSTNDGADSGWQLFAPTTTWQTFEFLYDVPADGTATDYLALWADTSGSGLGVLVDALSIEATASEIPEFTAAIETEQQARIDEDTALSGRIDALSVSVGEDIDAAILTEQQTRADADAALAEDASLLSARVGTNESQIFSLEEAFADDQAATALRDSLIAVQDAAGSAMVRTEEMARVEEDTAIATRIDTLQAEVDGNAAALVTEQIARADADTALANDITTLQSTVDGNTAAISSESVTRASQDDLLAADITTVQTNLDDGLATVQADYNAQLTEVRGDVTANSDAITTAQASLGDDIASVEQTLSASVEGEILVRNGTFASGALDHWPVTADVSVVEANAASAVTALATLPSRYAVQITPTSGTAEQLVLQGELLPVTRDEVYVFRCDYAADDAATGPTLTLAIEWLDATGAFLSDTRQSVTADLASWQRLAPKTVPAPADARYARVSVLTSTTQGTLFVTNILAHRSDATLGALYTAKVDVNGMIGGFGVYNDGEEVDAGFDVDRFWVGRTDADKVKPFIIDNGTTYINEAVIKELTFNKLRADDGSLIVQDGKIQAQHLDADNLTVRQAESDNYVAGQSGWQLTPTGGELNQDVTFRGTVTFDQVSGAGDLASKDSLDSLTVPDTRNDNQPPSWYYTNYPKQTITEFKYASVVGVSGEGTYVSVTTKVPWSGSSGGPVVQEVIKSSGVYSREGTSSSWSSWSRADNTGSNTAYDTARVSGSWASNVRQWALNGNSAKSTTNDWTRPNTTRIDGNKIYTGDAYVDTLQIRGNAVTIPASSWVSGAKSVSNNYWTDTVDLWLNPQGGATSSTCGFSYHASIDVNGGGTGVTTKYVLVEARIILNGWVFGHFGIVDYAEMSLSGYDTKRLHVRGHFTGGASTGGFSDNRRFYVQVRFRTDGYLQDRSVSSRHLQVLGTKR